jgi:hypothetical protein
MAGSGQHPSNGGPGFDAVMKEDGLYTERSRSWFAKVRHSQSVPRFATLCSGPPLVAKLSTLPASSRHCRARSRNISASSLSRPEAARRLHSSAGKTLCDFVL